MDRILNSLANFTHEKTNFYTILGTAFCGYQ